MLKGIFFICFFSSSVMVATSEPFCRTATHKPFSTSNPSSQSITDSPDPRMPSLVGSPVASDCGSRLGYSTFDTGSAYWSRVAGFVQREYVEAWRKYIKAIDTKGYSKKQFDQAKIFLNQATHHYRLIFSGSFFLHSKGSSWITAGFLGINNSIKVSDYYLPVKSNYQMKKLFATFEFTGKLYGQQKSFR